MSTKEKQGFGLYFLFAFGLAWLLQVYASLLLIRDGNAVAYQTLLAVSMFCPLAAVLLVKKVFLHQLPASVGRRRAARYWLTAWFAPAVFTVLAAVLYFAVFPSRLDLSCSWLVTAYGGEMDAATLRSQLGVSNVSYILQTGLFAITLAPPINMFFALGEEAGWRGYMMPCLKERFGLLNGRLLGGVIWGVWHWPIMLLTGYEYGTSYLGAPVLGAIGMVCGLLCPQHPAGLVLKKTGCIWVPAVAHGAFNAIASIAQVLTYPADAYYNVLGPMPIGLIGMLPMLCSRRTHPAANEAGRKELNHNASPMSAPLWCWTWGLLCYTQCRTPDGADELVKPRGGTMDRLLFCSGAGVDREINLPAHWPEPAAASRCRRECRFCARRPESGIYCMRWALWCWQSFCSLGSYTSWTVPLNPHGQCGACASQWQY